MSPPRLVKDTAKGETVAVWSGEEIDREWKRLKRKQASAKVEEPEPLIGGDLEEAIYSARRTGGTYTAERAGLRWTISTEPVAAREDDAGRG